MSIKSWLVMLLLIALTLSACSSTRMGYRFFDELVRWKVDDFVTLDTAQQNQLNTTLDAFLAWHQREQLPVYVQFLERQIALLQQPGITPAQLQGSAQQLTELLRISTRELAPETAALLQTLSDEQVSELLDNYDKNARKYERERILPDQAERLADREDRMRKLLNKWIGTLTGQQTARVGQWAGQLSFATQARLEQRQRFRAYLQQLLAARQQPQLQAMLQQVMVYPERQYTPAYRRYSDVNRQQTLQMLADIHASLTAEQKNKLLAKLKQYQADFQKLAQQAR
ncbi:MAG: DUF6279 family lipoprotein [Thiolinea sp.]